MSDKQLYFEQTAELLKDAGLDIISKDESRPWGGFYVIEEAQSPLFVERYFIGKNLDDLKLTGKISPKILLVAPGARLSWQYHLRRAEIWKCVKGPVAVVTSDDDEEKKQHILNAGEIINLKQGERHRLIGLDNWGIIAEIWQHTDSNSPSDEDDIVRVQDDYGR